MLLQQCDSTFCIIGRRPEQAQLVSLWPWCNCPHNDLLRLAETYVAMTAAVWKLLLLVLVVADERCQCVALALSQLTKIDTLTSHKVKRQM